MEPTPLPETTVLDEHPSVPKGTDNQSHPCSEGPNDDEFEALFSLQLDISGMEDRMKQLQQRKLDKLCRLNALHSVTRNLPSEMLLSIFHHVATDIINATFLDYHSHCGYHHDTKRNISMVQCASVCSSWRDAILSTPSLWTTLVLGIKHDPEGRFMKHFAMRTQQPALAVHLGFAGSHKGAFEEMKLLTLPGSITDPRLNTLRFHNLPTSWTCGIEDSSLHQVQCLSLERMDNTVPLTTLSLPDLPRLRRLTLRGISCHIEVPQNNISVLDFVDVPLDVCISIFERCSNVVKVRCRLPRKSEDIQDVSFTSITTFPFLKNFTWPLSSNSINTSFMQELRLPALEMLQLYGDEEDMHSINPGSSQVIQFFQQLPPFLPELELINWGTFTFGGLGQLLSDVRGTRKLVLRNCSKMFTLCIIQFLSLIQTESAHQPLYLPHLETLSIQSTMAWAHFEKLPELMKGRNNQMLEPFRLEISRLQAASVPFIVQLEAETAANNEYMEMKFLLRVAV